MNKFFQTLGLAQFFEMYPGMAIVPSRGPGLLLQGQFSFVAGQSVIDAIQETYKLQIFVPKGFPRELPAVTEIGGRIPRDGNYHVNPDPDNTLCLGSPLRLLREIAVNPTLLGFTERCLVPYLYAVSCKLKDGRAFAFGELSHGYEGIVEEEGPYFGVHDRRMLYAVFRMLCIKKRIANKHECPCGCGKRLGRCNLRFKINYCRNLVRRRVIREMCERIFPQ